jgi:3',5'-nucleoside bisphosphate phosphatase
VRDLADLHIHSKVSDGINTPSQLVAMAVQKELGAIALTDHDTLDGITEFMRAKAPDWLIRIPGVEISTIYKAQETHILGYFVPDNADRLKERLTYLEKKREERFPKMVRKLDELGIEITKRDLETVLRGVKSPGRPHLARLLVMKGKVKNEKEAFDVYLGDGKPAYVEKEMIDAKQAIALLRTDETVPVLAHPLAIASNDLRRDLKELQRAGLLGVEVNYAYDRMYTPAAPGQVAEAAKDLGLIETGGSDHHGDSLRGFMGDVTVPIGVVDLLRKAAMSLRKHDTCR